MALRIAIIGIGQFGQLQAELLASLGEFELVSVINRNPERFDDFARSLGLSRCHGDLDSALAETRPDALVVSTRTDTHAEFTAKALKAGCHVYLEKPAAGSKEEIQQLIGLEKATGRKVMVSHVCLFHSLFGPFYEQISERGFRHIRFVRHRPMELATRFAEETPVRLTMVHDLYTAARILGDEEPVSVTSHHQRTASGNIDMSWARMELSGNRWVDFESFWLVPPGGPDDGWDFCEVFGNGWHGRIDTNPGPLTVTDTKLRRPIGLEISRVEGRPVGMLAEAFRTFAAACNGAPVTSGCRLVDALRIESWMERILP